MPQIITRKLDDTISAVNLAKIIVQNREKQSILTS